jgi:hypothetical protein
MFGKIGRRHQSWSLRHLLPPWSLRPLTQRGKNGPLLRVSLSLLLPPPSLLFPSPPLPTRTGSTGPLHLHLLHLHLSAPRPSPFPAAPAPASPVYTEGPNPWSDWTKSATVAPVTTPVPITTAVTPSTWGTSYTPAPTSSSPVAPIISSFTGAGATPAPYAQKFVGAGLAMVAIAML